MLSEAESKDQQEDVLYGKDNRGDELPKELRSRKSRLAKLEECKKLLEADAKETAVKQEEKIKTRQVQESETGKKKRGRKPKEPKTAPEKEAKANTTDPDSRIMKTRSGYVQGYNAQAAVTEEQIIIAAELTQAAAAPPNDRKGTGKPEWHREAQRKAEDKSGYSRRRLLQRKQLEQNNRENTGIIHRRIQRLETAKGNRRDHCPTWPDPQRYQHQQKNGEKAPYKERQGNI